LAQRKEDTQDSIVRSAQSRKPVAHIALLPGKRVHCSRTQQSTSGLDCPCTQMGVACAPANSVCSTFSAGLSTCGCSLGTSVRNGARCQALSNAISARGFGFRIFSPVAVLQVSCKTKPCTSVGKLNVSSAWSCNWDEAFNLERSESRTSRFNP
jgi:hypothetical protein